jgi:hypothetical protein
MNTQEQIQILRAARARISARERWTDGVLAMDAEYCEVTPRNSRAVAWCAIGTLDAEMQGMAHREKLRIRKLLAESVPLEERDDDEITQENAYDIVTTYNDAHEHQDALRLFDRTIKRLEKSIKAQKPVELPQNIVDEIEKLGRVTRMVKELVRR